MPGEGGGGALRAIFAAFKIEVDAEEIKEADAKVSGFVDKLKVAGRAIGEALAVNELKEFVKSGIETGAHLQDLAERLDISASAVQGFGFAAQSAGVGLDSAAHSLGFFERSVGAAGLGAANQTEIFKALGVEVKDASGKTRPMQDILLDVADAFQQIPDHAKRATLATELFGREGRLLVPVLSKGREGLSEFFEEAQGIDKFAAQAKQAREAGEGLGIAFGALKNQALAQIFDEIGPPLLEIVQALTHGVRALIEFNKHSSVMRDLLGVAAVAAGLRLIGTVRALVTTFRGGVAGMTEKLHEFVAETGKATAGVAALKAESATLGTGGAAGPAAAAAGGAGAAAAGAARPTPAKRGSALGDAAGQLGAIAIIENQFGHVADLFAEGRSAQERVTDAIKVLNPYSWVSDAGELIGNKIADTIGLKPIKATLAEADKKTQGDKAQKFSETEAYKVTHEGLGPDLTDLQREQHLGVEWRGGQKRSVDRQRSSEDDALKLLFGKSDEGPLGRIFAKIPTAADEAKKEQPAAHVEQNIRFGDIVVESSSDDPEGVGEAAEAGATRGARRLQNANTLNAKVEP
jgi:hypothetical protein